MVTIHSQYRKHFKGPRWDNVAISEYNRKKDYCVGRRSVEHSHQPLEWDSDDSENSDGDLETKPKLRQVGCTNKTSNANRLAETEKAVKKQAWGRVEDVNKNNCANKEMATQTSHRKHSKHRKSKRKKREKSAAEEGKGLVSNKERLGKRVPFICYGWANNAPIEKKYTHNVRADSKDVYPASLRASKRRELDIAKRLEENKKNANLEREIMKEKFFNLSHISPMFMTEYQRSYCCMGDQNSGYIL